MRRPRHRPGGVTRLTHDGGLTTQPSVTDDGEVIVYASDRAGNGQLDLWLLRRGALEPVRLTADRADESEPSVSPGGDRVTFRSEREGGGIYVMPAHTGGRPTLIAADGHNPRSRRTASTSPTGWLHRRAWRLWFPVEQGIRRERRWWASAATAARFRDGVLAGMGARLKHVLVSATSVDQFGGAPVDWYVVPIDGGRPVALNARLQEKQVQPAVLREEMWRGDTIVFSASQADTLRLWRTHITSGTWKLGETAEELTNGPEDHAFATGSSTDGLVFASWSTSRICGRFRSAKKVA